MHGKRPYMERASVIHPGWLPEASPSLTTLSPTIRSLSPHYDADSDQILGWVQPTYGAAQWQLPPVPHPPPANDRTLRAALFGRALCEGGVLKALKPLAPDLLTRARAVSEEIVVDRAALALRSALEREGIFSRAALATKWKAEPRFLLRELAALLQPAQRQTLIDAWPRMQLQAEKPACES
eukprot:scaffold67210_cov30-Tisochrysis_lutea.AAC.1